MAIISRRFIVLGIENLLGGLIKASTTLGKLMLGHRDNIAGLVLALHVVP